MKEMILVTGANGQIGSVLTRALMEKYGRQQVLATDIREPDSGDWLFEPLDVLEERRLGDLLNQHKVTQIYHLAAILSAKGENDPRLAWNVNMNSLFNVLEAARSRGARVFFPSSIAVFGPGTPRHATPQQGPLDPATVYGISKVAGEQWCRYYHSRYGLDVRSLRYPGIIGYESLPGGGTTDYAVDIFHQAVRGREYVCFLRSDARLPMMYMPDAIRATLMLMDAPAEKIAVRTAYNVAAMSFSPAELAAQIQRHLPNFQVEYQPDFRQSIAENWPESIDDETARRHWDWRAEYDIASMTRDMLRHLGEKYQSPIPV
jgi:threonine 3-dehydrogenase